MFKNKKRIFKYINNLRNRINKDQNHIHKLCNQVNNLKIV